MNILKKTNTLKVVLITFLAFTTISCSDEEETTPIKIESISYTPNKAEVKEKKAFTSSLAKKTPDNAEVSFVIKLIKKGDADFTNPDNGFSISKTTGKITLKENHPITEGVYKITIESTDVTKDKNKTTTAFELTVKK